MLSPSTGHRGRHIKWLRYQQLVSLTDYLLVWQEQPVAEHFSRSAAGGWHYEVTQGLDSTLSVASLSLSLPLAQLYDGVEFSAAEAEDREEAGVPPAG